MNTKKLLLVASFVVVSPLCAAEGATPEATVPLQVASATPGIVSGVKNNTTAFLRFLFPAENETLVQLAHSATRITSFLAAISAATKLVYQVAATVNDAVDVHYDLVNGDDEDAAVDAEELDRYRRAYQSRKKTS